MSGPEFAWDESGQLIEISLRQRAESLAFAMVERTNRVRDEMLRRAVIITAKLPMTTTIDDIVRMGKKGLAVRETSIIYHQKAGVVAVYDHNRPVFWVTTPLATLDPGEALPWRRDQDDTPVYITRLNYSGDTSILLWMREMDWPGGWPELSGDEHGNEA